MLLLPRKPPLVAIQLASMQALEASKSTKSTSPCLRPLPRTPEMHTNRIRTETNFSLNKRKYALIEKKRLNPVSIRIESYFRQGFISLAGLVPPCRVSNHSCLGIPGPGNNSQIDLHSICCSGEIHISKVCSDMIDGEICPSVISAAED